MGYQAEGSLGRRLLNGVTSVKLFGEEIAVRARIVNFHGLSSHADRDGLLRWIEHFTPQPRQVFVVHGEAEVADLYAATLRQRGLEAHAPNYEEVYDLLSNQMLAPGLPPEKKPATTPGTRDLVSAAGGGGPQADGGHRPQQGGHKQGPGQVCRPAAGPHREMGPLKPLYTQKSRRLNKRLLFPASFPALRWSRGTKVRMGATAL